MKTNVPVAGCAVLFSLMLGFLFGLSSSDPNSKDRDPNSKAVYGEESNLPKNCRAYVQASIDDWRVNKYTAGEVMVGLERNCGASGYLWKHP